ncbi:MAG: cellulase family glycosylhydrolase [Solirubrobacterales bacterium]
MPDPLPPAPPSRLLRWILAAALLATLCLPSSAVAYRFGIGPSVEVSRPAPRSPRVAVTAATPATLDIAGAEDFTGPLGIAVDGARLVDGAGRALTLRGVNISGTEWRCLSGDAFAGPSDDASIAAIAAWRVNAVRIPLNEDCWLGINGAPTDVDAYRETMRDYVERLHAHGLYAILDLHWSAPGDTKAQSGQVMADADHSPNFWASVASYFRDDHAVLFDLYNEPRGISWNCWRNGCDDPGFRVAGMQQLLDAVRATGATQPVMVGGLGWATQLGDAWLEYRPNDPARQLVAAIHLYNQRDVGYFNANIGKVATQFPVVVGEIGETDCAHDDLDTFLPWADARGVSYVAWAWYPGACAAYPALIADYAGTPTNFGVGYRDHLLASFPAG